MLLFMNYINQTSMCDVICSFFKTYEFLLIVSDKKSENPKRGRYFFIEVYCTGHLTFPPETLEILNLLIKQ